MSKQLHKFFKVSISDFEEMSIQLVEGVNYI